LETYRKVNEKRKETVEVDSAVLFNTQVVQASKRYHKARNTGVVGFKAHRETKATWTFVAILTEPMRC
jgi:hypothetical protein